ncbi:MAG TPA: hypothetical protein PK236_12350, partial [Verrucomicrobiota bacterium]|nr:hypothetical protein [Verrucomicrobiota bacterium]
TVERVVFEHAIQIQPTDFPDGVSVWPIGDEARIRLPTGWATAMCCKHGTPGLVGFSLPGSAIAIAL